MKHDLTISQALRRELLSEWWRLRIARRLAKGCHGATYYMRTRQQQIEQLLLRPRLTIS
jgi:hypothetical protein